MKHLFFVFFLFASNIAAAQMPEQESLRETYRLLSEDFFDEALTMDSVTESSTERKAMIQAFRSALASDEANSFRFQSGKSWSHLWPLKAPPQSQEFSTFQKIKSHQQIFDPAHSIHDLDGYIGARLGVHSSRLIQQGKVKPTVLGGSESSLRQKFPTGSFYKLPSFYESWGIVKYLVSIPGEGTPRLLYLVPPSIQYLEHYQAMLTRLTGTPQDVEVIVNDRRKWKRALAKASADLLHRLGGNADYVSLGYFNQWSQIGMLTGTLKILSSSDTVRTDQGVFGRKLKVLDLRTGYPFEMVIIGNQKTIWGEASAFMLEGTYDLVRRGVIFMGSAGGLSEKMNIYDLSVPKEFQTNRENIPIENFILKAQQTVRGTALFPNIHGNTSSPAVQTRTYIDRQIKNGAQTIDVEQSLIAQSVSQYNMNANRDLQFGAINIITDKPFGSAGNDLDRIDERKKQISRLNAVTLALNAMQANGTIPLCRLVYR